MELPPLGARNWVFSGAVTVPQPAADGEMRVLGHHLSQTASQLYSDAQGHATWVVKVLPGLEDDKHIQACTPAIEHNIEQYLLRHMQDRAAMIANLPEDVPPSDGLRLMPVQNGDYRKGLKPLQDLAVHASRPYPANSVLGVYRSFTMLPAEELVLRHNPPADYPLSTADWRQAIDAYAAELAPPPKRTWGKLLLRDVYDKALQGQQLVCSGFGHGNILANVNDGCADPMSSQASPLDRPANVQLLPVAIGRWPFLFMVACQDIEPGELYLDYGKNYWEIQRDREMEIKAWQRELNQALQRDRMLQKSSLHCESVNEAHGLTVPAGKKKATPKQAMQSVGASAAPPCLLRKRKVGAAPADEPVKQAKKAKQAQQAAPPHNLDSQGLRTQTWHAPRSQQAQDSNEILPSKKAQHAQQAQALSHAATAQQAQHAEQAQQQAAWVDSTARDLWAAVDGRYWCPDPNCAKAYPQQLFKGYKTCRSVRRHVLSMVKAGLGHWGLELDLPGRRERLKSNLKSAPAQSIAAVSTALELEPKACTALMDSSLVPVPEAAASSAGKAGTAGRAASAAKAGTAAKAGKAAKACETGKAGTASQAGSRRQKGPTGHFLRDSTKPYSKPELQVVNSSGKVPKLSELGRAPSKQNKSGRGVSQPLLNVQQELLGVQSTAGSSHGTSPLTSTAGTAGTLQDSNQPTSAVSQLPTDTSMLPQQQPLGSEVPQSYASPPITPPMKLLTITPCNLPVSPPVRPLGTPPTSPPSKPLVKPLVTPPDNPPVSLNTATSFNSGNTSACHPGDSTASRFNAGSTPQNVLDADTISLPTTAPSSAPSTTPPLAPVSMPLPGIISELNSDPNTTFELDPVPSTVPELNAVPSTTPQLTSVPSTIPQPNSETHPHEMLREIHPFFHVHCSSSEAQTRLDTSCNFAPSSAPICHPASDPTPSAEANPSGDPSMSTPNCSPAAEPTPPATANLSWDLSVSTPNCTPAAEPTPLLALNPSGEPNGDPSLTLRATPTNDPNVLETLCTPSQPVKGHERGMKPMLDPSMGLSLTSDSTPSSLAVVMTQEEDPSNDLCGPLGNPSAPSIQIGVGPQDGRVDATGTPTTPSIQAGVTFKDGRGVSVDPKFGVGTPQPIHRATDTAGAAVHDVPAHTHRPHAQAEQLSSYMPRDCSEEEEEGDSMSSLGLSSLGHVLESGGAFPPLEELSHLCCSLQSPAGFGLPSAADLTAVSAAGSTTAVEVPKAVTASSGAAATAVEEPEPVATSGQVAVTAVEKAEAVVASSDAAATAVEEPATPEGCSSLTLLTTHSSSASDSLPGLPLPPLSSLTPPLPSPSSSAVGLLPGLTLPPPLASSAAPADGLSQSCPSSSALLSPPGRALLDPFCSPLISDTMQEDSQKIQEEGQENSWRQRQCCSPQGHLTSAQTVRLCKEDERALLKELAGIQVDKQRLCSQKHLLSSMFERLKQEHVWSSLRKKRIAHLLASGIKSKTYLPDQPALTHLTARVDSRLTTHSFRPNRSKLPPSVRESTRCAGCAKLQDVSCNTNKLGGSIDKTS